MRVPLFSKIGFITHLISYRQVYRRFGKQSGTGDSIVDQSVGHNRKESHIRGDE